MRYSYILHEGHADKSADNKLLKRLLEDLGLNINKVIFLGMGNKSNFFKLDYKNYNELKLRFLQEQVDRILFIIDADYEESNHRYGGYDKTKKELEEFIKKLDFYACVDIYVMCDPNTKVGYLESLILSTLDDKEKQCVNDFLACSHFKSKQNDKAVLNQIYNIAYPQAPYNFKHKHFDLLKQKLRALFAK